MRALQVRMRTLLLIPDKPAQGKLIESDETTQIVQSLSISGKVFSFQFGFLAILAFLALLFDPLFPLFLCVSRVLGWFSDDGDHVAITRDYGDLIFLHAWVFLW